MVTHGGYEQPEKDEWEAGPQGVAIGAQRSHRRKSDWEAGPQGRGRRGLSLGPEAPLGAIERIGGGVPK